jgi:hypothetical protein
MRWLWSHVQKGPSCSLGLLSLLLQMSLNFHIYLALLFVLRLSVPGGDLVLLCPSLELSLRGIAMCLLRGLLPQLMLLYAF